MRPLWPERIALARTRGAIDRVDDGLIVLLAVRRRLVRLVATIKPRLGVPPRDRGHESQVYARAHRLAERMDLPTATVQQLMDLIIGDACRQQEVAIGQSPFEDTSVDVGQEDRVVAKKHGLLHLYDER